MQGGKSLVVHIIDDDEAVRESLEALLFASGFDASVYESAEDYLARAPVDRGCLLLDVNMPGMSGLDLLQHLKDQGRPAPVVFLSANPDQQTRSRAMELGAHAFLAKPVAKDELLSAIADAQEAGRGIPL